MTSALESALGKKRELMQVDTRGKLAAAGLGVHFPPATWRPSAATRELATRIRSLTKAGVLKPFVFVDLRKYALCSLFSLVIPPPVGLGSCRRASETIFASPSSRMSTAQARRQGLTFALYFASLLYLSDRRLANAWTLPSGWLRSKSTRLRPSPLTSFPLSTRCCTRKWSWRWRRWRRRRAARRFLLSFTTSSRGLLVVVWRVCYGRSGQETVGGPCRKTRFGCGRGEGGRRTARADAPKRKGLVRHIDQPWCAVVPFRGASFLREFRCTDPSATTSCPGSVLLAAYLGGGCHVPR